VLGKSDDSKLELLGLDRKTLSGQTILVSLNKSLPMGKDDDPDDYREWYAHIPFILRNVSVTTSGPINFKWYTNSPWDSGSKSSDEPGYEYEKFIHNEEYGARGTIPGGV